MGATLAGERTIRLTQPRTRHPFDGSAPTYDRDFTSTAVGRRQRNRVWEVLDRTIPSSGNFLDLGCGTGEDALWLARRGTSRVVGCDASQAMLEVARAKADAAGVGNRVTLCRMDLARIAFESNPGGEAFDGAVSNFGALNCIENRRPLAEALSRWLIPGAPLVIVLMGPWCAWEVGWHLLRLEPGKALRRRRQGREVPLDGGGSIRVWYPRPRQLRREFNPFFEHVKTIGVGAFLPPSYLGPVVARRPWVFLFLNRLEERLGDLKPWSWMADHVLLVYRRIRVEEP